MRSAIEANPKMSETEARELITRMLKVMYYRDKLSLNKVPHRLPCPRAV